MTDLKEAVITDVSLDGNGVASEDGKKIFIPFTLTGERVSYRAIKKKKKFDEAHLIEIIEPSAERVEAKCPSFTVCGGCATQHITPAMQLAFKEKSVLDTLQRIGQVSAEEVIPALTDKVWGYRRRARLGVKYVMKKDAVLVGFREKNAPYIVQMSSCEVLDPKIAGLIQPFAELIYQLSIRDKIPQLECSIAENATSVVMRVLETPSEADVELLHAFQQQQEIRLLLQPAGLKSIYPLDSLPVEPLYFTLQPFNLRLQFTATDFIQIHAGINNKMVVQALDWLQVTATDRVLDLFCGLGNFSLPLAQLANKVLGIEGDAALIQRAKNNATLNKLNNVQFKKEDLFKVNESNSWLAQQWDLVLIDPPRSGAKEVIDQLHLIAPKKVLYVSCHPASLARDANVLVNTLGYRMTRVCVINMFPHTGHVETMALFEKLD
ncbi:MAG: 23S rRNA (uracil(1939)-C(5))-methyltransferase RlmD [Gammaproteobacteria bacterium]|nr:23S rRNA (uracil(1939)-C(5))-methyltransferase RlmD [Gammaproteobacteria bacterium]